ncbi:CHASE2 domain-containing protein [uncultured Roseobacter sp.]|uniref:CHASE2 domain-containing protein n=1 Tax=uncultured Roseobacter sp. TaxID=114847 RepID=UPI00261545FE|nr:adenylate/guanylate cyclase domain-containing protein [uncultured Roseobacter sp.]
MTPSRRTPVLFGVLMIIAAFLWAAMVSAPHVSSRASGLDRLEAALLDIRFSLFGAVSPSPDVVIVAIDDVTLAETQKKTATTRLLLADTIDAIAAAEPKVIGLDVILADAGAEDVDDRLAAALGAAPMVIAAGGSFVDGAAATLIASPVNVLRPQPAFADVADVGLVNLSTDATGVPRYVSAIFATDVGVEPSFALRIAARFTDTEPAISADQMTLGDVVLPLDVGFNMPLRLIGPQSSIPTYSAIDVLSGDLKDALANKVVILGYTATAFGDRFPSPFDESVPGVEIMATAVSQMLGGETLRRDEATRRMDMIASFALAVLGTLLVLTLPLSAGVPLALGFLALWGGAVLFAFSVGIWLSAAVPLVSAAGPLAGAVTARYYTEKRRANHGAKALAALKQFQSPALAEMIADDPSFLKEPTAKSLSIFFIDLSSFTHLSEWLGPARTQDLLKHFHQITAQAVETEGGVVLNYMGDGALAVFGMTDANGNSADQALRTSFALIDAVRALGQEDYTVGCRIGLHHGDVILSRLGGDRHQQVSVAGDSVNLASRLLEIAKTEGATIAATDTLLDVSALEPPRPADSVKPVPVRGREGWATVHFWSV